MGNSKISRIILTILLLVISVTVNAQKLPATQQISLWAPANIKIDGKATEWGDKFQAYNHATDLFYSIVNDNKNLYLIIQAVEPDIIYKIINGGITFTVNASGKKIDSGEIIIKYPVFGAKNMPSIDFGKTRVRIKDSSASYKHLDSFRYVNDNNKQLADKSKEIKISGIKAIGDSLISIYNEYGIRTAQLFDNKLAYTYELEVPLKYLGLSLNNPQFVYNIKVNGMYSRIPSSRVVVMVVKDSSMGAMADTDFWGEYTLAKK